MDNILLRNLEIKFRNFFFINVCYAVKKKPETVNENDLRISIYLGT